MAKRGKKRKGRGNGPRPAHARPRTRQEALDIAVRERILSEAIDPGLREMIDEGKLIAWRPRRDAETQFSTPNARIEHPAHARALARWLTHHVPDDFEASALAERFIEARRALEIVGDRDGLETLRTGLAAHGARLDARATELGERVADLEAIIEQKQALLDLHRAAKRVDAEGRVDEGLARAIERLGRNEATPEDIEAVYAFVREAGPAAIRPEVVSVAVSDDGAIKLELADDELADVLSKAARDRGLTDEEFVRRAFAVELKRRGYDQEQVGADPKVLTSELAAVALSRAIAGDEDETVVMGAVSGDERVRIPLPDGREASLPIIDAANSASIWMPTATLARFSELAREEALELALPESDLAALEAGGRHTVGQAEVRQGEGGHHYVRTSMNLCKRGGERWDRDVDLPMKQFGLLLDGFNVQAGAHAALERPTDGIERPRWIGSRSFGETWDEIGRRARVTAAWARSQGTIRDDDEAREIALRPSGLLAIDAVERLAKARVLSVDVDVFEGAPEWESLEETWAFARDVDLPFDPLYMDLTAPGDLTPLVVVPDATDPVRLHAALMWRNEEGGLTVAPVGWPSWESPAIHGRSHQLLGRVHFGGATPDEAVAFHRVTPDADMDVSTVVAAVHPLAAARSTAAEGALALGDSTLTGRVEPCVPFPPNPAEPPDVAVERMWAALTLACAARALSVLGMLDAINVQVAEAAPDRDQQRQIKRAVKRGWPFEIADTVTVRPSKYQPGRERDPDAPAREYSHAFWRRGHYAYYPLGTRMADRLAEENPQDRRLVDHPTKGLCRKVFRGPTVIGRTDADGNERRAVEKTRVWKAERRRAA